MPTVAGGAACRLRNTLSHLAKRKRKSTQKYKNGSGNRSAGERTHQFAVPRSAVLELFLSDYESPLQHENNQLRRELPVCAKNIYVDANGTYKTEISEEQQKTLQRLINWQYYKLFDEKNP